MRARDVHAATDVTGFGLLGHLRNLLRQSGVAAVIDAGSVPVIAGIEALALDGHVPGGSRRNRDDLSADVSFAPGVPEATRMILCDSQTSGGLLIAAPEDVTREIATELGDVAWEIGRVESGAPGSIEVR